MREKSVKKNSTFAYDLAFGKIGEDWVEGLLTGTFSIEVKTDRKAARTGNVFIEVFNRDKPSGISTTKADYWIYRIHDTDSAIIIPVRTLKMHVKRHVEEHGYKYAGEGSKGALIPIKQIIQIS